MSAVPDDAIDFGVRVVHPQFLDGAICLTVDRFASLGAGGITETARLIRTAKDIGAVDASRLKAARELWRRIGEAADCIPLTHAARRAKAIVHVPISTSNKYALNAVSCAMSEAFQIDVYSDCLFKRVSTLKMKGASMEVKRSIAGTFDVANLPDGPLLLVDDIVESGATLAEARRTLTDAGSEVTAFLAAVDL